MRIAGSQMMMGAGRSYLLQTGHGIAENAFYAGLTQYANGLQKERPVPKESDPKAEKEAAGAATDAVAKTEGVPAGTGKDSLIGIRDALLQEILRRMLSVGMFNGSFGGFGGLGGLTGAAGTGLGLPAMQFDRSGMTYTQLNYMEQENTSFVSQGFAKTEDGRVIDFDVRLSMSRAFLDYTQIRIPSLTNVLYDPLVINVGSACAMLSDQTFRFDLDTDGEADDISLLEKGSGFLALDHNEDGIINDGSELFGVKSGNGFEDLRAYDTDGNGWIDENDEVFEKLRVWYKHADGTDELIDLKTADVGAIFLGHEQTDFSLYGAGMRMNGMIRATGMFLKESGSAGTIQHVDLAKQDGHTVVADEVSGDAGAGKVYDINLMNGKDGGALVIRTAENAGAATAANQNAENGTEQTAAKADQSRQGKQDAKAKEAARRKEQQAKHAEEVSKRKALTEEYHRRRQLRKEELQQLFEERIAERKETNDALYNARLEENALAQQMLSDELAHEEALNELVEEQIMSVA